MASIDIPCPNQECDSEDITLINSKSLLSTSFKHNFKCDICGTTFSLITALDSVKIPGVDF